MTDGNAIRYILFFRLLVYSAIRCSPPATWIRLWLLCYVYFRPESGTRCR